MSLVDQYGNPIFNQNERDAQQYPYEERALTQKEIADQKLQEQQEKAKQQAARNLEKAKESAWTHKKLEKLALDGGVKKRRSPNKDPKENELPVGGITEDLDVVDPIIFERLGEPREFTEDMNMIRNGLDKEKLIVEGNEMQAINLSGEKYLFGLLIRRHIFDQGYSISIGDNDQPILRDERPNPDSVRKERMKGLQDALSGYEFSKNIGSPLSKNDNTSLLSEYIAADTYAQKPNLIDHRNALARKVGIISPTVSAEQAKKILESTALNPQEKSFLLAWKDTGKDKVLSNIQSDQETFVKNARENFNQKSPEMNRKELIEQPFTKIPQLLMAGAIGVGLLLIAARQWKKGGIWGSISGLILGLIGFSVVSNQADGAWKKFGLGEKLNDVINEGKPIDRAEAADRPLATLNMSILAPIQANWTRFQARMAGGQEGIKILMNPKVGQKIAKDYPVYSMLNTLNPDDANLGGKYEAPTTIPGANPSDIKKGFENLSTEQPDQLNTLLKDTWERYQTTQQCKDNGKDASKTTNLADMLVAIEREDGWLNKAIDAVSDEPEKQKALKVIGQNPKEWSKISINNIKKYFLNQPEDPGNDWKKNHTIAKLILECEKRTPNPITNPTGILIDYFKTQDLSKPENDNKSLKDFLEKK